MHLITDYNFRRRCHSYLVDYTREDEPHSVAGRVVANVVRYDACPTPREYFLLNIVQGFDSIICITQVGRLSKRCGV